MSAEPLPVLICVDDESHMLDTVERVLRQRFQIRKFCDPARALEFLKAHSRDISVIISDFRMPQKDGITFLDESKKMAPNAARILMSGQVEIGDMEIAINQATIHKFVSKPWKQDEFIMHVMGGLRYHKTLEEKDKFQKLSITDPITQLTNHRYFQEKLRLEWDKHTQRKDQLSLAIVDIDYFKRLNDQYGHPEGDNILSLVSQRMVSSLPSFATLSRYGGEEFGLILPNCDKEKANEISELLRKSVCDNPIADHQITVSVGVSTSPEFANSVDELILGADQALYQAKRLGRNQTVVGLPLHL